MKINVAFSYLSLAILVAGEDIDEHDVPRACISDCRSSIDLSARCENSTDGDSAFNNCVCGDTSAQPAFNSCAACAKQNGFTSNDDNGTLSTAITSGNNTGTAATNTVISVSGSSTVVLTTTSTPSAASQTSGGGATSTGGSAAAGAHATAGIGAVVAGLALGIPALI